MQLLDIRPDHLQIVQDILQKYVPECEVWAFGSRAKWLAKEYSDLDLCIVDQAPLSFTTLGLLKEAFADSDLPWKVDVVDWANISESFRAIIERDKVVVWEGKRVKDDWQVSTVGEFCPFIYGKALPERSRVAGAIPVISSAGVSGSHHEPLVKDGGIVIGRKGTVGSVTLCKSAFWAIDTAFYVPDAPHRNLVFTYYLLKTLGLECMNSDSAVPGLNRDNAHARIISAPPKKEQDAIAHILGTLDDKIEINRKQNETLEAMARALFKAWFVDFEPVRAKQEGRHPPGLSFETAALFPSALDDSGKPDGWMESCIGDEVKVLGGATPSTKEPDYWINGMHYWVTPKILSRMASPVLLATERRITDKGLARISSGLLPVGAVLLSSRAPIGYLAITEVPTAINQGFIAMVCNQTLPSLFVFFWCKERMNLIVGNANGSTFQEINKANFKPIPVILPSKPVLNAYIAAVNPMYRVIVSNLRETASLVELRDSLSSKLISGQIRIGAKHFDKQQREGI